jgi:hypothetical protein
MSQPERPTRGRARTPQRVRVTSPRMAARRRPPTRSGTRDIAEQTGVGEVYTRSLLRTQLRLGLSAVAVMGLGIGSLPALFAVEPQLATLRVLTVPLPWLLVGVAVYPLLVAIAWWHVRASERAERDFATLVERR